MATDGFGYVPGGAGVAQVPRGCANFGHVVAVPSVKAEVHVQVVLRDRLMGTVLVDGNKD